MKTLTFPPGFRWGFATSSFQIEGAPHAGGRGESIWDRFCATPGKISDGTDGTVACDHFHRYAEDVALMKALGARSYRFSLAWPRILPSGRGAVNDEGLAFYDRLVDALLAQRIEPVATLYHWDLPQALQDAGGWADRSLVEAFVEYTDVVARRLGDRVKTWITHNEPWCTAHLGHHTGEHAPGHTDPHEALIVAHHVLLSHGGAVATLRARVRDAQVGIALNLTPSYPASPSAADREAARHYDAFFNRWYLEPIFKGRYPEDGVADKQREGALPAKDPLHFVRPGDLQVISAPIDFLGINYYSREVSRSRAVPEEQNAPRTIPHPPAEVRTDMGWEVYPDGLADLLRRVHRDYAPKAIVITENGAAYATGPDASGQVPDEARRAYLEGHLAACHRAIADGVPLTGYFVWSLLDNFEWAHGYTKRFGVVWVDFTTQRRIPKASALWYRDVARANALTLSNGGAR